MNNRILSSIIAAGSILIFFLLVLPAFDQTRMLRGSIKERDEILKEAEELLNQVKNLNGQIEARKSEIDKLDRLFPREKELPEFLSNIESIVSASGMILSEMNLSEVPGQGKIRKINGTLKLTGKYPSLVNLLDLLEKNLRLIEVGTVDAASQLAEGVKTLNYDLSFEINYLAPVP
ncbi:MAG: type 4a pilus biogenesis protein PilO [Parcubacteria group bacterium]|nr:type 4a pilus biogenesis protein PilO [Parcubacteria group bacterium]